MNCNQPLKPQESTSPHSKKENDGHDSGQQREIDQFKEEIKEASYCEDSDGESVDSSEIEALMEQLEHLHAMSKIKRLTLVKAQKMTHQQVVRYVTRHPSS